MTALEPRKENGHTVVALICDRYTSNGRPVPRSHLATLGRHARTLLEDGFDLELVLTAAEIALRRGSPQFLCFIAHDLQQAQNGTRLTRRGYEKALEDEMELSHERTGRAGLDSHG